MESDNSQIKSKETPREIRYWIYIKIIGSMWGKCSNLQNQSIGTSSVEHAHQYFSLPTNIFGDSEATVYVFSTCMSDTEQKQI